MKTPKVWARWAVADDAIQSARRLQFKYGRGLFAVTFDDMGIPRMYAPYAVISSAEFWEVRP